MMTHALISAGGILAVAGSMPNVDEWVSVVGSLGGFGVLVFAVNYAFTLLKKKDEQIADRDRRIEELIKQLIENCKNCELTRAANKALIEDEK